MKDWNERRRGAPNGEHGTPGRRLAAMIAWRVACPGQLDSLMRLSGDFSIQPGSGPWQRKAV
ncbi:MAG: hypothetical protein JXR37_08955 [Kiritimatiellae bacterium]|nr:hypothetical protein [Kiritimatiellia bacterium]